MRTLRRLVEKLLGRRRDATSSRARDNSRWEAERHLMREQRR